MTSDFYFTATSCFPEKCPRKTPFKAQWGGGGHPKKNNGGVTFAFLFYNSLCHNQMLHYTKLAHLALKVIQVNNYGIVVNFLHISNNLT